MGRPITKKGLHKDNNTTELQCDTNNLEEESEQEPFCYSILLRTDCGRLAKCEQIKAGRPAPTNTDKAIFHRTRWTSQVVFHLSVCRLSSYCLTIKPDLCRACVALPCLSLPAVGRLTYHCKSGSCFVTPSNILKTSHLNGGIQCCITEGHHSYGKLTTYI